MKKFKNRKNLITVLVTIVCITACFYNYNIKTNKLVTLNEILEEAKNYLK